MGPTSITFAQQRPASNTQAVSERTALVTTHMPMAGRIARGFAGRGQELDDLTQVAMLELVKAASRFDPSRGVEFLQYAYPCIVGGLKKHFRDNGWSLRITRRRQELYMQTRQAIPELSQSLGRTPTVSDLAAHLCLSEQDARDGVNSSLVYTTRSLNTPVADTDETDLGQLLGVPDERIESVADRHLLGQHVALLPQREQYMLRLRFGSGLCQREIAEKLGISQMHVSRLIAQSLGVLRASILAQE